MWWQILWYISVPIATRHLRNRWVHGPARCYILVLHSSLWEAKYVLLLWCCMFHILPFIHHIFTYLACCIFISSLWWLLSFQCKFIQFSLKSSHLKESINICNTKLVSLDALSNIFLYYGHYRHRNGFHAPLDDLTISQYQARIFIWCCTMGTLFYKLGES